MDYVTLSLPEDSEYDRLRASIDSGADGEFEFACPLNTIPDPVWLAFYKRIWADTFGVADIPQPQIDGMDLIIKSSVPSFPSRYEMALICVDRTNFLTGPLVEANSAEIQAEYERRDVLHEHCRRNLRLDQFDRAMREAGEIDDIYKSDDDDDLNGETAPLAVSDDKREAAQA